MALDGANFTTEDGLVDAYAAAKALQPVVDAVKRGTPGAVQRMMEMSIPLRPVTWWNEMYLEQLKLLCEAIYLCSQYHRAEIRADDLKEKEKYSRLAAAKVPIIKSLQVTLQLTPSSLHGQAARFHGATKAAQQVSDILTDVNDLYAH